MTFHYVVAGVPVDVEARDVDAARTFAIYRAVRAGVPLSEAFTRANLIGTTP